MHRYDELSGEEQSKLFAFGRREDSWQQVSVNFAKAHAMFTSQDGKFHATCSATSEWKKSWDSNYVLDTTLSTFALYDGGYITEEVKTTSDYWTDARPQAEVLRNAAIRELESLFTMMRDQASWKAAGEATVKKERAMLDEYYQALEDAIEDELNATN